MVILALILMLLVFGYKGYLDYKAHTNDISQNLNENPAPKELTSETEKPTNEQINQDSTYFSLNEGDRYQLVSDLDMFGESIHVLKQEGNAYLVKGQYGTTLQFYRMYLIDQEGVNIFYEMTEDKPGYLEFESLIESNNFNTIFSTASNQELFILKTPYEVGTQWGYGKIISADDANITVEYENGNKMFFEKPFGLTKIEYRLPPEMKDYYEQDTFVATHASG